MNEKAPQNIIFIILDSCRLDTVKQHSTYLYDIGQSNILFENAIAPANWTLPSHTSMFTGQYPHEHQVCTKFDIPNEITSLKSLGTMDYHLMGVTQNAFVGREYNWHKYFDEFYSTYTWGYDDGINIGEVISSSSISESKKKLCDAFTSYEFKKNIHNISRAGLTKLVNRFDLYEKVPHPLFDPDASYHISPSDNTNYIVDTIKQRSDSSSPFFIFANYMEPHAPYNPANQGSVSDVKYSELKRLNEKYKGMTAVKTIEEDGVSEKEVDELRHWYRASVVSLDRSLAKIQKELERRDIADETLIIIAGDHGESLGERDARGKVRFGHAETITDNVYNVPLIIAHPSLNGERMEEFVSLRHIGRLLRGGVSQGDISNRAVKSEFLESDPIIAESPADLQVENYRNENYPEDFIRSQALEHTVIGYDQGWKVVIRSNGKRWAWKNGDEVPVESAPQPLIAKCNMSLNKLPDIDTSRGDEEIPEGIESQLEQLGYL